MSHHIAVDALFVCFALFIARKLLKKSTGNPPLPPGPKPLPVLGNLLDLPPPNTEEWQHWATYKEKYGPISSISVLGKHMIILNDLQLAFDTLDKKSSIYSDRPVFEFGGIMCGWNRSLPLLRYGDRFRVIRKNLHQYIGTRSGIANFHPLEEVETRRFLLRTLTKPQDLSDHIRRMTGAIILKMSHGYTIEHDRPDPLVDLADQVLIEFSLSCTPGAWLVDILSFLKNVPDWLPGTAFKRIARRWRYNGDELVEKPHAFVKEQMAAGIAAPSLTRALLEKGVNNEYEEFIIKWSAAAVYGGGADTTVAAIYSFFLSMVLNPEVQRKAQEEIDRVIGDGHLPSFSDRENLPYVNALVKETLRFFPVVPMGIPHVPTEDSVISGYFVPKGSLIMANIWQFNHDPQNFREPHLFTPERFMPGGIDGKSEPERDTHDITFGFGRRICPGKELADASIFISIAMSLAVFTVSRAKDPKTGKEIEPLVEFATGVISRPKDFVCSIKPRSEKAASLIRSIEIDHPFEKSDAEALLGLKWDQPDEKW